MENAHPTKATGAKRTLQADRTTNTLETSTGLEIDVGFRRLIEFAM